ncbi:aldehyde dehydrogenase [Paragemmobacter straminiformis]|uniref:Aldehyde dehydrogenase n=1 Tax=Paragemmobacter straminiformis TaxID=2045119 RepID=A0A842I4I5_9RHOB|nr:aldehyde dehydrogenase [Gemmobacter straminiformis]MBC2834529.1 aldehyde dehydrogenase [Gemmobacter straminiformis]
MQTYSNWINGTFVEPSSSAWIDSVDPYRNEVWARIPASNQTDADRAVAAAKAAMTKGPWATMTASARGRILSKIADVLEANIERLAILEVRDNGKLLAEMRGQVKYSADYWRYYAGLADKIEGSVVPIEKADTIGMTFKEPVGVVLAITAWNSPLTFFALKCAPALAAGCAVVLKPSEFSSVSSLEFAALTKEAGLPDGVINVVSGYGADIGSTLVEHPDVAQITFTGSDQTGAHIYAAAARHMKRVAMELGGKSPNIVFEDADLEAAAHGAVSGIFGAAGQMCTAGSRLLVQNSIRSEFTQKVVDLTKSIKLGDPTDPATQMGPISNAAQHRKVLDYIGIAKAEGAVCTLGGVAPESTLSNGLFISPTIFTGVTNDMRIAQEEVFGPVLSVIGFEDEAEAIQIGNDIAFGLAAGVWTKDIGRMMRMTKDLNVGTVWGNTYRSYSYTLPFGGRKRSGIGRENGIESINEFLETKSLMLSVRTVNRKPNFVPD